jgi:predicted nucleic acid-binding protein
MRYLLDTNSLTDFYEPASSGYLSITDRVASLPNQDLVFASILSLYELEYGYANATDDLKPIIRQRISEAQMDFAFLSLLPEAARIFGRLKARLRMRRQLSKKASKSHNIDLMLAATAIVEGCTLVSADGIYSDLRHIDPTLRVENWLASS